MNVNNLDESYKYQSGDHLWGPTDYPFYGERGRQVDIRCRPADNFTALVDTRDGESRGIVAMSGGGGGLFSSFTAAELRECADQFKAMADHMDAM